MGFWTSSSPSPPAPKISTDGTPIAPDRTQRAKCWEGRDAYFQCLDKNGIIDGIAEKDKAEKACKAESEGFERSCASSWALAIGLLGIREPQVLLVEEKTAPKVPLGKECQKFLALMNQAVTYFKKRRVMEYQKEQTMKRLKAENAQELPPGVGPIPPSGP